MRRRLSAASPIQPARKPASSRSSAASTCSIRRRCSASASRTASALSRKMSTQIRGFAPATRVMSRSEPPAPRERLVALDPRRAGLVDEHVREHVRQVARQRDEPVVRGRVDRDRGAELGDEAVDEPVARRVGLRGRRQEPGRARRRARPFACSGPRASEPQIGWPPTKRGEPAAAATTLAFVEPTSVTVVPSPDAASTAATCAGSTAIGAATTARSAPASSSAAASVDRAALVATASVDRVPRPAATARRRRSARCRSQPATPLRRTPGPLGREPGPSRPPISPVPNGCEPTEDAAQRMTVSRRHYGSALSPHQLGEAEGEVERLPRVQARVAERHVAVVELLLEHVLRAAEALR